MAWSAVSAHMKFIDLLFTGDLILDEPDADYWLSGFSRATRSAALTIGHLEVPHTLRGTELRSDVPAAGADPDNLAALRRAGFDAVTLAGNHIADCGPDGIIDTCAELDRLGVSWCGAGVDLTQATRPAWLASNGRRVALLSYNCVGPEASWAGADRAGCAYVKVGTADGAPITPAATLTQPDANSVASMTSDIKRAHHKADLVIVALHKGILHTPARLASYERPLAHAAIDAGASVVIGHHAHIVRGIEIYRSKPIFHGLGNGCVVTRALSPDQSHAARAAWAKRRKLMFGFEPDPAYSLAPFHPEAVHSMLGVVRCYAGGTVEHGFIPVYVEPPGRPVIADNDKSRKIAEYILRITELAGLPALSMQRRGEVILVS
jgi:poly-gamma-glutamate capsule biosynthesis protein CapA/YwtB (metallophosphatase superfamily)